MEFVYIFVGCFLIYYSVSKIHFIIVTKNKKNLVSAEVQYILKKYKLNPHNVNLTQLKNVVTMANGFLCSIAFTFGSLIDNVPLMLLIVFVCMIPSLYITYDLIGKYYAKKRQ